MCVFFINVFKFYLFSNLYLYNTVLSVLFCVDGYLNMKIQVYYNTIHPYYIYILFLTILIVVNI